MSVFSQKHKSGFELTMLKGMRYVRGLSGVVTAGSGDREADIRLLREKLDSADAVVIGAGAGLSTAAGFTYGGERFRRYFYDFSERFGINDMYSGGFYPFPDDNIRWAWWARNIYYNRYVGAPEPVYDDLLALVKDKDYFAVTTNVDHQFQKAGFEKERLFYTQGDYGLFQSASGRDKKTWDNEEWVMEAMAAQRFVKDENGVFQPPKDRLISMILPDRLIPVCPGSKEPAAMNLRVDDTFAEDEGWHAASDRYAAFLSGHEKGKTLFLEIGVGSNTPMIIKYPFWAMTAENPDAFYACLNFGEAACPAQIKDRAVCVGGDCGRAIKALLAAA